MGAPLYGLLLAGGKSSRMGRDKAELDYYGMPQTRWGFELLMRHCQAAFVSCRPEQADGQAFRSLPQIPDAPEFAGLSGPLAGIISALQAHPDKAWLVLACDLPLVDDADLSHLLEARQIRAPATAYASPLNGEPEPLCAVYEPDCLAALRRAAAAGMHCPRKILKQERACLVEPLRAEALTNVNRPEELLSIRERLGIGKARPDAEPPAAGNLRKVRFRFYAQLRDALKTGEALHELALPAGEEAVLAALKERYPRQRDLLSLCRVALEDDYLGPDALVPAQAEVLDIISPVSGG